MFIVKLTLLCVLFAATVMANGWDNWGKNHWGGWSHSYGPEPWSNDYGYKWTNKKASVYHHRKGTPSWGWGNDKWGHGWGHGDKWGWSEPKWGGNDHFVYGVKVHHDVPKKWGGWGWH
ncbi:uncharacterized protein LOC128395141 [Panonychus citri]|uniref:uncharacterized protein LOC128395141 n=1 Tax=Panonychus citri TaxID=50023 RepID=UPI002307480F|nr:uncharacterized protein LOC128395141 [Panonychus citri]